MPGFRIEHVALNVADPVAVAAWYVEHLGMRVVRKPGGPQHIHFLADATGSTVLEIYNNPADAIPDYSAMHPMRFHVAWHTDDPDGTKAALLKAGATFVDEPALTDGSRIMMLRDPWGLPLQLAKRAQPLL